MPPWLATLPAATAAFKKAIDLRRGFPEAWNELGFALRNEGRYDESVRAYDEALRQRPRFPEALCSRGIALMQLRRREEALDCFDQALAVMPNFVDALSSRATALLEMNRLGMLVDVSHVSDDTIADVLETSRAPVFASHSSCRALSNIPRNLTDDQIRSIAATGGVVMVNIGSIFLDQKVVDDFVAKRAALMPQITGLAAKYRDDPKKRDEEIGKLLNGIRTNRAPWTAVVDHIERILKVGGPSAAGLGTDFDGIEDPPDGLEDVGKLPRLTEELLRRGHSEEVVRGVLGENFLRFWERANAARSRVPPRKGPLPFSKP